MNKIEFSKSGGFPLTQDALNFMQSASADSFQALAGAMQTLCGNQYVILSGCDENDSIIGSGFVSILGEIMPLQGGAKGNHIIVVEEKTSVVYEDGISKEPYYNRYAKFGAGSGQVAWSEFKPTPKKVIADQSTEWENIPFSLLGVSGTLKARKTAIGHVELYLSVDLNTGLLTDWIIDFGILPAKFRPNKLLRFPVIWKTPIGYSGDEYTPANMQVETDGSLRIQTMIKSYPNNPVSYIGNFIYSLD